MCGGVGVGVGGGVRVCFESPTRIIHSMFVSACTENLCLTEYA